MLLNQVSDWLKGRFKVRPTALKGAPGVKDPRAAAAHANGIIGSIIDAELPNGLAAVENALKVHSDQLTSASHAFGDHEAGADVINLLIKSALGG